MGGEELLLAIFLLPSTPSLSPSVRVSLLKQLPPGTSMGHENIPQSPVLLPFHKGTHRGWAGTQAWVRELGLARG